MDKTYPYLNNPENLLSEMKEERLALKSALEGKSGEMQAIQQDIKAAFNVPAGSRPENIGERARGWNTLLGIYAKLIRKAMR